jgi:hypothetical protein
MTLQTASRIAVVVKRETTTGTAATASGATTMRIIDSPGLALRRAQIQSVEKRADGNMSMPRSGYKSVDGSHTMEATVGGAIDIVLEAILRSTWVTATNIAFASVTSVTFGSNEVVANAGDWVGGQGVRVGDIFFASNYSTSGNNGVNARVIAVTSLTISVPAGTFTAGSSDATGTLTFLKKLKQGSTPVRYSHTIEQNDTDIDLSELFLGCRAVKVDIDMQPGQPVTFAVSWLGMDRTALATGTSPWFTSPSVTTGLALIPEDSSVLLDGVAVATYTGLRLSLEITANGQPVIGSLVTPDIFDNDLKVTGQLTGLRSDFANLTKYDAETEFSIGVRLEEPGSTPKSCLGIWVPRAKIANLSAQAGGGDGAKIETLDLVIAPKVAATGFDGTVLTFHSSAA